MHTLWMELSLRRLRILREVADHGGVTAAAEAMRHSTSGVSQQLAALERSVGAAVLERHGRGVRLTEVGTVLLTHTQRLLDAEQAACAAVEVVRDTPSAHLRVGVFCTVAAGLVPWIISDLAIRHPGLQLSTHETDPDDAPLDLRHGHLDVAFMLDYPDAPEPWVAGVTTVPAGYDTVYLAVPAGRFDDSQGRPTGPVDLADFATDDWVLSGPDNYYGRAMRGACRQAGFEPTVVHRVNEQPTALAMVAAGLGSTLMSDLGRAFLPPSGVDIFELAVPVRRQLLIGHDTSHTDSPSVRVFVDSALRAARAAELPPRDPLPTTRRANRTG
ncbi:MAG: LysR substrate-binding domain-containing protein [Ornithinimicrobium sp.]